MPLVADSLRRHPELALFLALALGYGLSRIRIGIFQLNLIVSVLLAGVLVGQAKIPAPPALQWAFFCLFLFSVGYKTGPQFFRGLGRDAAPQVAVAVVLCAAALACGWGMSRILGFDAGVGAGMLAGATNTSAAVGTAGDAIERLAVDSPARGTLATNLAVAFAVTYLVGLLTEIVTLAKVAPWLMRVDLAKECRTLELEMGIVDREFGIVSAYRSHVVRAYEIPTAQAGQTVAELERLFAPERIYVERIRTHGQVREIEPETRLDAGDTVVLAGNRHVLTGPANPLCRYEVDDPILLDIASTSVEVVVTKSELVGHTIERLAATVGQQPFNRGVFVRAIRRAGTELPLGPGLVVERGDVMTLIGAKRHLEKAVPWFGTAQWPTAATDMLALTAATVIGGLVGLLAVTVGHVEVGLGLPVGILAGGLVTGYLHSIRPVFGHVPEPALWLCESFGLSAFIALIGIGAGPGFLSGLRQSGTALLAAPVVVCLVPNVVAILVGRLVFRLHPGILLGVCAGASASAAGLAAVQDAARSRIPTLGYGVSYAVGSLLLTLWGSVLVVLLARVH